MPAPLNFTSGIIIGTNEIIEKDIELTQLKHKGYWKCKCLICNSIRSVRADSLNRKCRDCAMKTRNNSNYVQDNLIGKKFGLWTVIDKSEQKNYWICKCECGTIKKVFRGNLIQGTSKSCGCVSSWGEKQIIYWLNYFNIEYKKEVCFDDFKTDLGGHPRFDFVLYQKGQIFCIIEYDGVQHQKYDNNWKMSQKDFERLQYIDELKNQYCKNNNLLLYRFNKNTILEKEIKQIYSDINNN